MIVVADTGPLNYLLLCGQVQLLPELFGSLLMPPAVHREIMNPQAPAAVRTWAGNLPAWVKVQSPQNASRFADLGPGEREAISLAMEVRADFVLMDETHGRQVAVANGVAVKGTLGVLEEAAGRGLIELRAATIALKSTGIFLAEEIIEAAIERDRSRRQLLRERSKNPGLEP